MDGSGEEAESGEEEMVGGWTDNVVMVVVGGKVHCRMVLVVI